MYIINSQSFHLILKSKLQVGIFSDYLCYGNFNDSILKHTYLTINCFHIETLRRDTFLKLGKSWSITLFCDHYVLIYSNSFSKTKQIGCSITNYKKNIDYIRYKINNKTILHSKLT